MPALNTGCSACNLTKCLFFQLQKGFRAHCKMRKTAYFYRVVKRDRKTHSFSPLQFWLHSLCQALMREGNNWAKRWAMSARWSSYRTLKNCCFPAVWSKFETIPHYTYFFTAFDKDGIKFQFIYSFFEADELQILENVTANSLNRVFYPSKEWRV